MVKIIKKVECSRKQKILVRVVAVLLALLTSSIFIVMIGHSPLMVYKSMIEGSLGSMYRFKETLTQTIPLVITSLGIAVAFKMKFWNIGAEGQIMIGAMCASFFALKLPDLNRPLLLIIMFLAAIIGGGLWALIPAYFKVKNNVNETVFTLMMNYIAIGWVTYLQYGPWKDKKAFGFPKIPNFSDNALLPRVFGLHIGWIIAIILIVLVYVFINYTKIGYEITVIGESPNTARYAGINVTFVTLLTLFISGAIVGMTGMIQASAVSKTLSVELSGGVGFTAIITTWLSGLNPIIILFVSFLFAAMVEGGSFIQTAFQISQSAADILQAMILFFVLGSEFFINYEVKR